jgi:hypothetical protein
VAGTASAADSAYTPLDLEACTVLDRSDPQGPGAWSRLRCDGLPGYPVLVSDDDGRMSLDYGPVSGPGRWESFSAFNRVHDVVEWRLAPGEDRPFATIHRWYVSDLLGGERQVLVVSTVATEADPVSCVVGLVDVTAAGAEQNRLARQVADEEARGFRCGLEEARYHGPISEDPPQFSPATREPDESAGGPAAVSTPAGMLLAFWQAARSASDPAALAAFRLDGAPGPKLFGHVKALSERYEIGSVEPLVVADAERRLAVVLRPIAGEGGPRSAEVGVVRIDGDWQIASADW